MIKVEEVPHNLIHLKRYRHENYVFDIFLDEESMTVEAFMSKDGYFDSMITCGFSYPLGVWRLDEALEKARNEIVEHGEDYIHRYEEHDKVRGLFGSPYSL